MKNMLEGIAVVTELEEKGCQQAVDMALRGVFEVKLMISDLRRSPFKSFLDILDNSRTNLQYEYLMIETDENPRTKGYFSQRQLGNRETYQDPSMESEPEKHTISLNP